ncbi:MAG: diguanylate cyclase [Desulfobacter sp.]|nr:MAG: diguanylate cyclase [Desulfobacter sp.]
MGLFWNKLLAPKDPHNGSTFMEIPGVWNKGRGKDASFPAKGFATFRLQVHLNDTKGIFAVRMKEVFTAYRLWIDDREIFSCGRVGKTAEDAIPRSESHAAVFTVEHPQFDILLQVSNFHYKDGGINDAIEFGTAAQIQKKRETSLIEDYLLFGSLLIMSIYHFGLFGLRREDLTPLLFGVFCLIMASRILVANDIYFTTLFPAAGWHIRMKIIVLGYYLGLPVFVTFINQLYQQVFHRPVIMGIQALGTGASLMVLVTGPSFYPHTEIYYQTFIIFSALYVIFGLIRAMNKGMEGAKWILLGFLALFATVVNDILYDQHVGFFNKYQNLLPFGLFIFIFSQSYILSVRFSNAFKIASIDHLCQVFNRRRFMELAEYERLRFERSGAPLCLLSFDADHFKAVNDTYGHDTGDRALKTLAKTVKANIRKQDVFGRMGGEEFSLLLPETSIDLAVQIAERLRHKIKTTPVPVKKTQIYITVSIGTAIMTQPLKVEDLLKNADLALYQAKENGRDQVSVWDGKN